MGTELSQPLSVSSTQSSPDAVLPNGIKRINSEMQRKFQSTSGSRVNLRILIRGDRAVGKTALFKRLEEQLFVEEHFPTPEIQVTHIPWSYKTSDEVVKVELWDVVDKALKTSDLPSLLLNTSAGKFDATSVDLYRAANAVIIIVDPTRRWTLEYVEQMISTIPENISILILVNFIFWDFSFNFSEFFGECDSSNNFWS